MILKNSWTNKVQLSYIKLKKKHKLELKKIKYKGEVNMLNYVSVDNVKSMYNVESMEDVTIAYYVFFNYSYTEIAEIYIDEIRHKVIIHSEMRVLEM